jgi:hypothetical protein
MSVKRVGYGVDDQGIRVQFVVRARDNSLFNSVQAGTSLSQTPIKWILGAVSLREKVPRV